MDADVQKQTPLRPQREKGCQGFRRTPDGCGGLGGENPGAFPKAGSIFQQPLSFLESAQTLERIACRAAGKSGNNFLSA